MPPVAYRPAIAGRAKPALIAAHDFAGEGFCVHAFDDRPVIGRDEAGANFVHIKSPAAGSGAAEGEMAGARIRLTGTTETSQVGCRARHRLGVGFGEEQIIMRVRLDRKSTR